MKGELPIIHLYGDPFYIDKENAVLKSVTNPDQELAVKDMIHTRCGRVGMVYRFFYDTATKDFADLTDIKGKIPDSIQYLEIMERLIDHPPFPSAQQIISVMTPIGASLFSEEDRLTARVLPSQNIMGTEFIIDTFNFELRQMRKLDNRISFDQLMLSHDQKEVFFEYNVQTKNIARQEDDQDAMAIVFMPTIEQTDSKPWRLVSRDERAELTSPKSQQAAREKTDFPATKKSKGRSKGI